MGRQVFQGTHGKFYVVDGVKYDVHFPVAWAVDHGTFYYGCADEEDVAIQTGPKHCENCKTYGSYNGVFISYCGNCAAHYTEPRIGRPCTSVWCLPIDSDDRRDGRFCEHCFPWMSGVNTNEVGDDDNHVPN